MKLKDPTSAEHDKPLAQQTTDFTAEGSPPAGKVARAEPEPVTATATRPAKKPRGPARAPGTRNGPVPRRTHPR